MIKLSRIKPSKIICYGKPFDEMKGDIIEVDYAKTNNLQKSNSGLYIKTFYGYVDNTYRKGGGSANGQNSGNPEPEQAWTPKDKETEKPLKKDIIRIIIRGINTLIPTIIISIGMMDIQIFLHL